MKRVVAAVFASLVFACSAWAEEAAPTQPEPAELFSEQAGSHIGAGFVVQIDPATDTGRGVLALPIRFYGVRLDDRGQILAYDSASTLGIGGAGIESDPALSLGFEGRIQVGAGLRTPGVFMLYGMGTGELGATLMMSGVAENQLRPAVGVEGGFAVAGRSAFFSLGGTVEAAASILNPAGDYGELPVGARTRLAIKDVLFLRVDVEEVVGRTSNDPRRRAGDVFLNFKLGKDFRPWTPALKFLIGVDGRVEELDGMAQAGLPGNPRRQYYGGVHLITYKD